MPVRDSEDLARLRNLETLYGQQAALRMEEIERELVYEIGLGVDVVRITTFKTDRGSPCFVIANGFVKPEASPIPVMEGHEQRFRSEPFLLALENLKAQSLRTAFMFKRDTDTRLCWRRYPGFEFSGPDEAKLSLTFRIAWD